MTLRYPPLAKLGIWNAIDDPWALEVASRSLDFIIIDLEHGFRDFSRFAATFVWLRAHKDVFVRVRSTTDPWLQSLLDLGVETFLLPQVESLDEVEAFARRISWPPDGDRGIHPRSRFGPQARGGLSRVTLVPIIEKEKALQIAEGLLEMDSVSGLYFGAYDLAANLGFTGPEDPDLLGHMKAVSSLCSRNQKDFMCMPMNENQLAIASGSNSSHYLIGIDTEILTQAVTALGSKRVNIEPQ